MGNCWNASILLNDSKWEQISSNIEWIISILVNKANHIEYYSIWQLYRIILSFLVTGFTSKGWGMPIPGPHLRSPLKTFEDCIHCGNKYHKSTMCPTTFTLKRCIYCNGNHHSPTQCPIIITQAYDYPPHIKVSPLPVPPKPEEEMLTFSQYPEHAIKPLP